MPGPLQASLDHLQEGQTLVEQPFRSHVPLLGRLISWFRTRWNNVSTTWYVRPLIAQQNRFNAGVVEHLAAQNARVDRQEVRTEGMEVGLQAAETQLSDTAAWLEARGAQLDEILGRLEARGAQLDEILDRLHDHDAWLITRDREQSAYVRDLAEVTLQLIQLKRQLQELNPESPAKSAGRSPDGLPGQPPAEQSE
jgi:chromosome segregation ATPase